MVKLKVIGKLKGKTMKFEALPNNNKNLTDGKIYTGSIVVKTEGKNGKITSDLKIAVFNDEGKLRSYPPSYFMLYEE